MVVIILVPAATLPVRAVIPCERPSGKSTRSTTSLSVERESFVTRFMMRIGSQCRMRSSRTRTQRSEFGMVLAAMIHWDLIIRNATIVDGTRAPRFQADVVVRNGLIERVGTP